MSAIRRRAIQSFLLVCLLASPAFAELVTPSERVRSRLNVRQVAVAGSRVVGAMRPGDEAELLATATGWHQVRLADGTAVGASAVVVAAC